MAPPDFSPRTGDTLPRLASLLATGAMSVALVSLIGRLSHRDVPASWLVGSPHMHWVTVCVVIALSVGILLRRPVVLQVLAVLSLLLLLGVIVEKVLVDSTFSALAPESALSLVCCAALGLGLTRGWPRQALTGLFTLVAIISCVVATGYLYGLPNLYEGHRTIAMALPTCVALVLLAWALACLVPDGFFTYLRRGTGPDAQVLRWMLPFLIAGFPLTGLLALLGLSSHTWTHAQVILAVMIVCGLITLSVVLWLVFGLGRAHRRQEEATQALADLNNQLKSGRDKWWLLAEDVARDLQVEKDRFERTMGRLDDMVFTVQMTGEKMEVVYCTPRGEGLIGADVPGEQVLHLMNPRVHPDDRIANDDLWWLAEQGEDSEAELRILGLDDVERVIWIRLHPSVHDGKRYIDGIVTNITDRRRLQDRQAELLRQETEQVRQLRSLSVMRDEFMAIAGHELRTPLAAVQGYCELLLDEEISDSVRHYGNVIARRSTQLNALVEDFFDLAKLNLGKESLNPGDFDLGSLVEDVIAGHMPTAEQRGISLAQEVEHVSLYGDKMRLRQCFDNLISNAVKYNADSGSIRICGQVQQDHYVLTVTDTGLGIAESHLPYVFDPFYRTETSYTNAVEGIGLGLSLTRALVELHGGSITVDSRLGEGTSFTVVLPLAQAGLRSA